MNSVLEGRHEIKAVIDRHAVDHVRQQLRVHRFAFYSPYPTRQINNIYYDSETLNLHEETLSGCDARYKVRYRWYGRTFPVGRGQLEIKHKRHGLVYKDIYPLKGGSLSNCHSWSSLEKELFSLLDPTARFYLHQFPNPVVINTYTRDYFLTRNQKVRVTIDRNSVIYPQRWDRKVNRTRKSPIANTVIVEVKCASESLEHAWRLLRDLPLRVSSHSKYGGAVQCAYP